MLNEIELWLVCLSICLYSMSSVQRSMHVLLSSTDWQHCVSLVKGTNVRETERVRPVSS